MTNDVNLIQYRKELLKPGLLNGVFRKISWDRWIEERVEDHGQRKTTFSYRERQRDASSLYLSDLKTNLSVRIDLKGKLILYGLDASGHPLDTWKIAAEPQANPTGWLLTRVLVSFSSPGGSPIGYVQLDDKHWSTGGIEEILWEVTDRDEFSVHLIDPNKNRMRFDLKRNAMQFAPSGREFTDIGFILKCSTKLNGFLINAVAIGEPGSVGSYLRQIGPDLWIEESARDGSEVRTLDELSRGADYVELFDSSSKERINLQVAYDKAHYSFVGGQRDCALLSTYRKREFWREGCKITSRSALTEEYFPDKGKITNPLYKGPRYRTRSVYRTSINLPPYVTHVDVSASEETSVTIQDGDYTIDKVRLARVRPSKLSKLTITLPANALHCPTLYVRTNLMARTQRHVIHPDVEVHKKIVELPKGALRKARKEGHLPTHLSEEDADHLQEALQTLARTVQYSHNRTPHGVHHDRAVCASNLKHRHFILDFGERRKRNEPHGTLRYRPLRKDEVHKHIAGARLIEGRAAQGIFDDIGKFFMDASQIIVHTAENVAHDVVDTADHVVKDVTETVHHMGEHLVHGDILDAGWDLVQGGEHLGKDLAKGAAGVVGDVLKGSGQLVVVTLKLGGNLVGDIVQFVLHNTGFVGQALSWLLEKSGVVVGNFLNFLLDKIGWGDVIHTHDVIIDSVNKGLDEMALYPAKLKTMSDSFFTNLANDIRTQVDLTLKATGAVQLDMQPKPAAGHSEAVEKIEWLLGKIFGSSSLQPIPVTVIPSFHQGPADQLVNLLENEISADDGAVKKALDASVEQLLQVFTEIDHAPQHLLGALLEVIKGIALFGLDVASKIIDLILDLVAAAIVSFKELINREWHVPFLSEFYAALTDGRKLTLLSVASLLIAIPTTIIHAAVFKSPPFASVGAAQSLTALSSKAHAWGIVYGSTHIVLSVVAAVNDVAGFLSAQGDAIGKNVNLTEQPITINSKASLSPFDAAIRGFNGVFGFVAQFSGNPITPGDDYSFPKAGDKNDVFRAPSYWSHVVWWFQWGAWGFDTFSWLASSLVEADGVKLRQLRVANDILASVTFFRGVAHIGLMSTLDVSDRKKREVLGSYMIANNPDRMFETDDFTRGGTRTKREAARALEQYAIQSHGHEPSEPIDRMDDKEVEEFLVGLKNFYEWARYLVAPEPSEKGAFFMGIPTKGFSNVMDCAPEIAQAGALPSIVEATEGFSLVGTVALDVFGHLSEGITAIVRTEQNALV